MKWCNLQAGRLQFAKPFAIHYPPEISAGGKCLDLLENGGGNGPARELQKEFSRRVKSRGENKTAKHNNYMNTLTAKGHWNIAKGRLKQKFAQLTDDELQFIEGKEDELIGRIQKRTGQARGKIKHILKECCGCKL